jgi:hypothetical protein
VEVCQKGIGAFKCVARVDEYIGPAFALPDKTPVRRGALKRAQACRADAYDARPDGRGEIGVTGGFRMFVPCAYCPVYGINRGFANFIIFAVDDMFFDVFNFNRRKRTGPYMKRKISQIDAGVFDPA